MVAKDYAKGQRILADGEVFQVSERAAVGFMEDDEIWMIALKRSMDGQETYLTSLHRVQKRDLERMEAPGGPPHPRAAVATERRK